MDITDGKRLRLGGLPCGVGLLALGLFLLLLLGGCRDGLSSLGNATGKPGEVLVVGAYSLDKSAMGDSLRSILCREYPYLPQSERSFSVSFVGEKGFNHMLQPFRNIIFIREVSDSLLGDAPVQLRLERDKWAEHQLVLYLLGNSMASIQAWLNQEGERLYEILEHEELVRLSVSYTQVNNEELMGAWRAKYGRTPLVPASMQSRREEADYSWGSLETPHISQGLIIYRQPLRGGVRGFSMDSILAQRDRFTRVYLPGPNEGTYMMVSQVVPPEGMWVRMGEDSAYYIRGFWEVHGHAMGGSFVSYSYLTPGGDSILTVGGYIYAPRFEKRDYMRQLEAMLGASRGDKLGASAGE